MGKDLLDLFCKAKKAADIAAAKEVPGNGAEVSRCIDALNQLGCFPITNDLLVSTMVAKKLRPLTKHPKESIRTLASEIIRTWKAHFIEELNNGKKDCLNLRKSNMKETTNKAVDVHRKIIIKLKINRNANVSSMSPVMNMEACRIKIREHLVSALLRVATEAGQESDLKHKVEDCDPVEVSAAVETAMLDKIKDEKKKIRSILFNLSDPKNPDLRRKVLLGEVKPERLMTMSNTEMASEELQLWIKRMEERAMEKAQTGKSEAKEKATTDQFKCGRCGERKTVYHQMQTRSADEPMTTYVTCMNCNHHWKFC
ncbi:Transcription elongation factor A protein 2 [Morus notabilis]|uniref:Transcription elongation factor n=1 Tax=Morus notabilis TaxID=981085 RepID=W9RGQ6_9ROSA|nr:transcription elongation factor TFIIS [Morus notabilis]EXB74396.1 Transcription elongation factor A protein 2 [Morus notabilis]